MHKGTSFAPKEKPPNVFQDIREAISSKKSDNAFRLAMQDLAKALQRIHGDGLVMLKLMNGLGIDAVLMDQRIGRYALLRHGLPQRFITDHAIAPYQRFDFIIFGRLSLYYTQKSNYNDDTRREMCIWSITKNDTTSCSIP